jgi:hypothetical protein
VADNRRDPETNRLTLPLGETLRRPQVVIPTIAIRQEGWMFSIGQFSRITGLTIKTIRLYHERGILSPGKVDPATGYRYFDDRKGPA